MYARGASGQLQISPLVDAPDWAGLTALRTESRARGVEGFMLKQREGRYGAGVESLDDLREVPAALGFSPS